MAKMSQIKSEEDDQKPTAVRAKKRIKKKVEETELACNQKKPILKKGRPKKELHENSEEKKPKQLKYTSIELIKNQFIKYMSSIGYTRGLVFPQKQRKLLRAEQQRIASGQQRIASGQQRIASEHQRIVSGQQRNASEQLAQNIEKSCIKWDEKHTWHYEEQIEKAKHWIQAIVCRDQQFSQEQELELANKLLDIGDIFPREITSEVYKILCHLYLIAIKDSDKPRLQSYARQVLNSSQQYIFLTGKFSIKFGLKQKNILKELYLLFKNAVKFLKQICLKQNTDDI